MVAPSSLRQKKIAKAYARGAISHFAKYNFVIYKEVLTVTKKITDRQELQILFGYVSGFLTAVGLIGLLVIFPFYRMHKIGTLHHVLLKFYDTIANASLTSYRRHVTLCFVMNKLTNQKHCVTCLPAYPARIMRFSIWRIARAREGVF